MRTHRAPWRGAPDDGLVPLRESVAADVCIVGAGIAGLAVAQELTSRGAAVVVLESRPAIAAGETGASTAHLVTALDRGWTDLVSVHGIDGARHAAASHAEAIARAERLVAAHDIACGFRRLDGYLVEGQAVGSLPAEWQAARRAGVRVELVDRAPVAALDPGQALRFPDQAQLDPVAFAAGLARTATAAGCRIHPGSHVTGVERGQSALRIRVGRGDGEVACRTLVLASNAPMDRTYSLDAKQAAYRTYAIAATVRRGMVEPGLYWDTEDPFHYVRLADHPGDREREWLIVGGEDHKTGQDGDGPTLRYERLEQWAVRRFPGMEAVEARWSGQVMETMDGLAFIGAIDDEPPVYVITGDCGNGITHGLVAAVLLPELIAGREHPWKAVYDPHRVRVHALPELIRENANVVAQLGAWLTGGDVEDPDDIPPGAGAVVRRGLSKVAVYREADGRLVERSAVCPHLGCLVRWNAAERTWDCPCHGSRFDVDGRVLHGPAAAGLGPAVPPPGRR